MSYAAKIESLIAERDALKNRIIEIERIAHYPDCWDDSAYPNIESALRQVFVCDEHGKLQEPIAAKSERERIAKVFDDIGLRPYAEIVRGSA